MSQIIDKALEPYEIHIDAHNYALMEATNNKDKKGNIIYRNHGYFRNIESAVLKVVKIKTDEKVIIATLQGYIAQFESVKNEIINALKLEIT